MAVNCEKNADYIKSKIRNIPDFPKKGIMFKDITTLLKDAKALRFVIEEFMDYYDEKNIHFDKIVSAESRGFIFGAILAHELRCGFVPIRKPGKLPGKTVSHEYELEYGQDKLEIHEDALDFGDSVLIVDDLLATGGTSVAAIKLCEKLGAKVKGIAFLVELGYLHGREKLKGYDVFSLVDYDSEE